jgi:cytochrome P450
LRKDPHWTTTDNHDHIAWPNFSKVSAQGGQVDYPSLGSDLPLLGRCLLETLRKWPVVPNGTFREITEDDYITGVDGGQVRVAAGTYVQITNWMRHRSKELWGEDALHFNPERDFTPVELSMAEMAGYNPASPRFSPFTYGPRDCMGRNFAQMEMRLILAHLFRNFSFALSGSTACFNQQSYQGINRGTMGPQNLDTPPGAPPALGLLMRLIPRN